MTAYHHGIFSKSTKTKVKLFASEYNIAPITATMPVTLFSLELENIQKGENDKQIPTFVWLKRAWSWDWNNLPENVYMMPTVRDADDFFEGNQKQAYKQTSKWIKELYKINPDSKFNLFYNDYYAYGLLDATVANGLPADAWKGYLLSDGNGSFGHFNNHFQFDANLGQTAAPMTQEEISERNTKQNAEYQAMLTKYNKLKTEIAKKGSYKENKKYEIDANTFREYAYVMATEESNVEYWLSRYDGTIVPNVAANRTDFDKKLISDGKVVVKDIGTLLRAIEGDPDKVAKLKALYKFSDVVFEKAEKEGKKVMLILGTWWEYEYDFADYVNATRAFYGDEYVYYYKGHPRNPTTPKREKEIANMGLEYLDPTVPAELFFFFNPTIFGSGYNTTTFVSVNDDYVMSVYHQTKELFSEAYKDKVANFISVAEEGQYYSQNMTANKCLLIEFADTSLYDYAIFDTVTKQLKHYKISG